MTNKIYKVLHHLLSGLRYLLGTERIVLNASDIDSEFLDNFDSIGEYERVFPTETRTIVRYPQTISNLSKGTMSRKNNYTSPLSSFSVSSPCACFPQDKALTKNEKMTNSFLNEFDTSHLCTNNGSCYLPENFIYAKKLNGYIKNWYSAKKHWNDVSLKDCALEKINLSASYFNMHKLNHGERKRSGSVLLLDLYLS